MKSFIPVVALSMLMVSPAGLSAPPTSQVPTHAKMAPGLVQDLRRQVVFEGREIRNLAVVVRLSSTAAIAQEVLSDTGITFLTSRAQRPLQIAGWHAVRVADIVALRALLDSEFVTHVAAGYPRGFTPSWPVGGPFVEVLKRAKVPTVHPRRDASGARITGQGVVIADIDDGVDPFHPLFFRADGGFYRWFDEDGDGRLTPGVDRVDFDRDGSPDGVLRLLESGFTSYGEPNALDTDGELTAGRDYLYYDYDGDGQRDVGPPTYNDASPSMGEPLFIVDDVDGDGQLSPQEALIGLKTSKLKAVWTPTRTYQRGVDLSEHPISAAGPHGTGVAGVLVGGVAGHSDLLGVAPGADLITLSRGNESSETLLLDAIDFARSLEADLILHEYGNHFAEYGDGSSAWEQVLDGLTAEGIPQLTATHNFAGAGGHGTNAIAPGETQDVILETLDYPGFGNVMLGTLRWPGADLSQLNATLLMPNGAVLPFVDTEDYIDGWYISVTTGVSDRNTGMATWTLARLNQDQNGFDPLGNMQATLQLTNASQETVQWQVHISDETGYSYVTRVMGLTTDVGTMAHPSTADTAISVGAGVGNIQESIETPNGLRFYSGQGPRIDGVQGIDIVAPTDHYSPLFHATLGQGGPHYGNFGGTSGALPVATAAAALLLQQEPTLTPEDIRSRLASSAAEDGETGPVPNNAWGAGRIQIHQLVFGEEPPVNVGPVAKVSAFEVYNGVESVLDATGTTDADHAPDTLTYRWDFDYDGQWDAENVGDPTVTHTFAVNGELPQEVLVKFAVEDPLGYTDEALAVVTVVAGSPPEPEPEASPESGPDAAPETNPESGPGNDLTGGDTAGDTGVGGDEAPKGADGALAVLPGTSGGGCSGGSGDRSPLPLAIIVLGLLAFGVQRRRL